jgi:hypothetical protein
VNIVNTVVTHRPVRYLGTTVALPIKCHNPPSGEADHRFGLMVMALVDEFMAERVVGVPV